MSVKKMLDRIVSPRLIDYGFRFSGKEGPMRWVYSRKQGEIEQQVTFQKSH